MTYVQIFHSGFVGLIYPLCASDLSTLPVRAPGQNVSEYIVWEVPVIKDFRYE